jgi:hypothetical protein
MCYLVHAPDLMKEGSLFRPFTTNLQAETGRELSFPAHLVFNPAFQGRRFT